VDLVDELGKGVALDVAGEGLEGRNPLVVQVGLGGGEVGARVG
jgi:hypothetical protein